MYLALTVITIWSVLGNIIFVLPASMSTEKRGGTEKETTFKSTAIGLF